MIKCVVFISVVFATLIGRVVFNFMDKVLEVIPQDIKIDSGVSIESNEYSDRIYYCSNKYGVDVVLIKAIIKIESNYDPFVVSKSNAVGLMQLKADTAGRDVYKLQGKSGKPSMHELKNANINIDIGTAYLSMLQKQLSGVVDPTTKRYAIIVSYVNGLGALLRLFSIDKNKAICEINRLSPEQFCHYVKRYHPSKQAYRYLSKINAVYYLENKQ